MYLQDLHNRNETLYHRYNAIFELYLFINICLCIWIHTHTNFVLHIESLNVTFTDDLRSKQNAHIPQTKTHTFPRLLVDNIEEIAPLIYTPTVGHVCQQFGTQVCHEI